MGRPNTMTELVKPNKAKGLKGKYRTKYNGVYRWYRANSKQESLTMFHADNLQAAAVRRAAAELYATMP